MAEPPSSVKLKLIMNVPLMSVGGRGVGPEY